MPLAGSDAIPPLAEGDPVEDISREEYVTRKVELAGIDR